MAAPKPDWKSKDGLAVGKGATVQEFMASFGADKLKIDIAPGAKAISRSTAGKSHTSMTSTTGARHFASSKRLPSVTSRDSCPTPRARGRLP